MMNPIVEMRRLHCKPYHELMQIAIDKYGFCPNGKSISKVELITYIIAFAAMRGDMDPIAPQENKNDNKRTRFILDSDGDTYHIMLTKEQTDFMDWCFKNCIDFNCAGAEEIKDVNWEMP
jgi:hypothetical protein